MGRTVIHQLLGVLKVSHKKSKYKHFKATKKKTSRGDEEATTTREHTVVFNIIITSIKHMQALIHLVPQHIIAQEKINTQRGKKKENHLVNRTWKNLQEL